MPGFNLKDYEEVKDRIPRFWAKYEDGAIVTDLLHHDELDYIVKASLINGAGQIIATGLAQERVGSSPVNKTSALENCETSAIGRALANAGFSSGKNRPSREEMDKAARADSANTPGEGGGPRSAAPQTPTAATKPQRAKLEFLANQTGAIPDPEQWPGSWPLPADLDKRTASAMIDWYQTLDVEPPAERVATLRGDE